MLVPYATSWKGEHGRARTEWEPSGGWEEARGLDHGGRGGDGETLGRGHGQPRRAERKKSEALWVFLDFQSSSLFTSILVVELCLY